MLNEPVGRPMEILLVEDGLVDARWTMAALAKGPVRNRLTLVRDGLEALDFLRRKDRFARAPRPDLILLDLLLPKLDGLGVLAEIKGDDDLKSIPVVVLTSSDEVEDRLRSERLGVESYITKPVDLDKFLTVIKELRHFWFKDLVLPPVD